MNPASSLLPDSEPLALLAGSFIGHPKSSDDRIARDHTNDQLIRSASNAGHISLAEQLKADRDRISKCSAIEPCALLACPRCSARLHRIISDATFDSSLKHLRKSKQAGLIDVRISGKGDQWVVYQAQVATMANLFVLTILVPAINKCKQVAGAHIALDIAPTKATLERLSGLTTGDAETLPVIDNAPVHVHFHLTVATDCVKASEAKTLIDRILAYIQAHNPGLELESHTTCIKNQQATASTPPNPNPMRPEYLPLTKSIQYNNKLQVGIKLGKHASTMTRMLRSHLVGHAITWDTGVYLAKHSPTMKTEEDRGRLLRLSEYMRSLTAATQSQPQYLSAAAYAQSIKHSVDQWARSLTDRIALDKAYMKRHGRPELETLWSDATGFDELCGTSRRYLAAMELIQSRQLALRDQVVRQITKLLLFLLRLSRKSIHLDTSNITQGLRRYLDLLTSADRARQRLYSLAVDSPESMAILEATDLLKSGNDVFPCWTPYDRPLRQRTRTWISLAANMLFAAPPIHEDLDERLTKLCISTSTDVAVSDDDDTNFIPSLSSNRIAWTPSTSRIEVDKLNIPQLKSYYAGRHPYGVPVHFTIPPEYLNSDSPIYLRDWQLSVIDTMRKHQFARCRFPVAFGKKWLLTHLPRMMPKATILIATQHQMDASLIFRQLLDIHVNASLVMNSDNQPTDSMVQVCASRRLAHLDCWKFNVVLTLDSQCYTEKSLEDLQRIRCDHWYDFTASTDAKEVRGPKVDLLKPST